MVADCPAGRPSGPKRANSGEEQGNGNKHCSAPEWHAHGTRHEPNWQCDMHQQAEGDRAQVYQEEAGTIPRLATSDTMPVSALSLRSSFVIGSLDVSRQHYTAIRRIVSISDYGSLRTVDAERYA